MFYVLLLDPISAAAWGEAMPRLFAFFVLLVILYAYTIIIFIKSKSFYWRLSAWSMALLLVDMAFNGVYEGIGPAYSIKGALLIPFLFGVVTEYLLQKRKYES